MIRNALVLALASLSVACAGGGGGSSGRVQAAPAPSAPLHDALSEVPQQRLRPGQCALVLWSKEQPPVRVLVAFNNPSLARVQIGKRTLDLPQVSRTGDSFYGFAPQQRFEGGNIAIDLDLDIEPRKNLTQGALVPKGALYFSDSQGWSTVTSVGGLIACEDNPQ